MGGFVSLTVMALASYAMFAESARKEMSSYTTVGTLAVSVTPYPASGGTEVVSITYNAPGQYDFSGWTIATADGKTHTIEADAVGQGGVVKVCDQMVSGFGCSDQFDTYNTLDNNAGTVTLKDGDGNTIVTLSYSSPQAGQSYGDAPDFKTVVLDGNAQVDMCRVTNQGYTEQKSNVRSVVAGKGQATPDREAIIPNFFYDLGDGINYFSGQNWPDTTGVYANGCVQ